MTYRADIDGLRALAVLTVLLFHADVSGFAGGFIGVDVFFVISGYLIGGMINAQLRAGTFSLGDFYKRRIMRIMPALIAMMLVTCLIAGRYFLPVELNDYGKSLVAATASVSNMYFSYTAGYFDAPALTKPLLHTWSLGVEEQFYIAFPLLMLGVARYAPRYLRAILAGATILSLVLAGFAAHHSPVKAFYVAPCRALEFLFGVLAAVGTVPVARAARLRDGIGLLGLAMILAAALFGSRDTPFLVMTGLASLGATLIILSSSVEDGSSVVGRVLALPSIRFVGLISYSVYLWHWPIIVFERSEAFVPAGSPPALSQAIVIALSLAAGAASWWFVERPFRSGTPVAPRGLVFGGAAAATLALCGLGGLLVKLDGLPSRFSPEVVRLASYLAYDPALAFRQGRCYLTGNRQTFDEELCLHAATDRPNYLLTGDSFAAHLWPGLSAALPDANLLQASMGQCRPVIASGSDTDACAKFRDRILNGFLATPQVDKVILAAAWKDEDIAPLLATIDALRVRGLRIVVVGPLVEYERALPRLLADAILRADPALVQRMRDAAIPARDRAMHALVTARGAQYVSVYAAACPGGVCQELTADGVPVQFDTGHLTAEGSRVVARRLVADAALSP